MRLTSKTAILDEMTDVEVHLRQDFIRAIVKDYQVTSDSDKAILEVAGTVYISALRLQLDELATGKILTNARQFPLNTLTRLLESMEATRRQKNRVTTIGKNGLSEDEQSMRDALLSLGIPVNRR